MAKLACFAFLLGLVWEVYGVEFSDGKNTISRFFTESSEDIEPFVFECPEEDGLHPNVRNCSTFIQCSNGKAHLMACPARLHFSVKTQRCERQCDAHCDRTLACECGWSTCTKDICFLERDFGPCRGSLNRYYYNKELAVCKHFLYFGCDGNENNFKTIEECEKVCGDAIDVCKLPSRKGPCKKYSKKYFFNSKKGRCQKFTYGGCFGNGNNFLTKEKCEQKCLKKVEEVDRDVKGEDRSTEVLEERTVSERTVGSEEAAKSFEVGSTNSGEFSDISDEASESSGKRLPFECLSDPDPGPCDGKITRWNYVSRNNKCIKFTFGGCEGNGNNFLSKLECMIVCRNDRKTAFKCPVKTGNFSVLMNCSQYIECKNSEPTTKECPAGQSFDSKKKLCVPLHEAICYLSNGRDLKFPIKFICPVRNGNFSVPLDCTKYIDCNNSESTPKECPRGQFFDSRKKICVRWYEAVCDPAKHSETASEHVQCQPEGDFPYTPDCKKFIRCRKTVLSLNDCPENKTFDTVKRHCLPDEEAKNFS